MTDEELGDLCERIFDAIAREDYREIDALLDCDPAGLDTVHILGLLRYPFAVRSSLTNWRRFRDRAILHFDKSGQDTAGLLQGLFDR